MITKLIKGLVCGVSIYALCRVYQSIGYLEGRCDEYLELVDNPKKLEELLKDAKKEGTYNV